MSEVNPKAVMELRAQTGVGMMDCKKALAEAGGNMDKAVEILRKKGIASAEKKAGREAGEGIVGSYIHGGGTIGVLIEVNCETSFVAKTDDFQNLVKDLAMQVAASSPACVRREEFPADVLEKEKEIYREQIAAEGKPPAVVEKIVEGRLNKFLGERCLLEQPYIKEPKTSVKDHIGAVVGKLGENIQVRRFVRFTVGGA